MRIALVGLVSATVMATSCSPTPKNDAATGSNVARPSNSLAKAAKPRPKAGLWENTMQMGGAQPMTVSSQICLDATLLKDDAWLNGSKDASASACAQSFSNTAGGYTFQSVCTFGERTVTSSGVATGDFNKAYKIEMSSKMDPAPADMPAVTKMTINAQWLGPCPAGVTGGLVPGSAKMTPG